VARSTAGTGRWEVRLAGNGGQGLVLAGIVLAEAAGLFEGAHVVQTQVYGPESRGGASRADVIIDGAAIDYPKVTAPAAMLVMSADAWRRYGASIRAGGTVVYDEDLVVPDGAGARRLIGLPLTAVARDRLGRAIVANVVGLAALVAATGVVSRAALEQAVVHRVPAASAPLNRAAVAAGWTLAADAAATAAASTGTAP
jgi:2-oxoglutarate ferredoxin oxidoreductase subunit gamma